MIHNVLQGSLRLFRLFMIVSQVIYLISVQVVSAQISRLESVDAVMTEAVQVVAGQFHTCALTNVGGVKCWGQNGFGQLGNGSNTTEAAPVNVSGLSRGVIAIDSGLMHSCALLEAGGVKCWGYNRNGELGDGTLISRNAPVSVTGSISNVIAITTGDNHTCALLRTSQSSKPITCWGYNASGQLGDGLTTTRSIPAYVIGLVDDIAGITAGRAFTCVWTSHGTVKCWGINQSGQLGNGTTNPSFSPMPVDVIGLGESVAKVSSGGYHSCALLINQTLQCWGRNTDGQLGDGTVTGRTAAVNVAGLNGPVASIGRATFHTCAVMLQGGIKCWGRNTEGQLGDGSVVNRLFPVDVVGLTTGMAEVVGGDAHTCARTNTGGLRCWGSNTYGQLGNNDPALSRVPVDVKVTIPGGMKAVSAGYTHVCGLTASTGKAQCWGYNNYGQLGNNNSLNQQTPVDVKNLPEALQDIRAGGHHSCALTSGGAVKCWGYNDFGQLGNNSNATVFTPVEVVGLSSGVSAISTGYYFSCALTAIGAVKCWGANAYGQLGDGTAITRTSPVTVTGLSSGVRAISAGYAHACAVTDVGNVKCWGLNEVFQLGNADVMSATQPITVSGLLSESIISLSAGGTQTCAITQGGTAKCWGADIYGQLGVPGGGKRAIPVSPIGLDSGVRSIAAGFHHTCAVMQTGAAKCWGYNTYGELGTNDSAGNVTLPSNVIGLGSGVTTITAGYTHSCVTMDNGTAKCWGGNLYGELGDGDTWHMTPVNVEGFEGVPIQFTGDTYEEDNTCAQAKPIPADGTSQSHTFHTNADEDWVSFNAISSTTYAVIGDVLTDSNADLKLELRPQCQSEPTLPKNLAFGAGVRMIFTSTVEGPIYLRLTNHLPGMFGPNTRYNLSVRAIPEPPPNIPGQQGDALIVVAGRLRESDSLQPNIERMADQARKVFLANRYDPSHIYFMSTSSLSGTDAVNALPTAANLEYAIKQWTSSVITNGASLTLYLVDHGEPGKLFLDNVHGEVVTPAQLDDWLEVLEAHYSDLKVNIIIEACYSGSFIGPQLGATDRLSKPGRVVIASTSSNKLAYASDQGAVFSENLLQALNSGSSLYTSFQYARWAAQVAIQDQTAWLDDDGDGLANGNEDGRVADSRGFKLINLSEFDELPPEIKSVTAQPPVGAEILGARKVEALVVDDRGISRVWAAFYAPSYVPPTNQTELALVNVPTRTLTSLQGDEVFTVNFAGFSELGHYRVVVFAQDGQGRLARPVSVDVVIGQRTYLPLLMR